MSLPEAPMYKGHSYEDAKTCSVLLPAGCYHFSEKNQIGIS